jgi:hypothetical protein
MTCAALICASLPVAAKQQHLADPPRNAIKTHNQNTPTITAHFIINATHCVVIVDDRCNPVLDQPLVVATRQRERTT